MGPRRGWVTRAAAVCFVLAAGAGLVVIVEAGLRVLDLGPDPRHDRRSGFSTRMPAIHPIENAAGETVLGITTPGRLLPLPPATVAGTGDRRRLRRFAREKPEDGFRIFVVGASSAVGIPYAYEDSFSGWLERQLSAELPTVPIEVVNAASSGYGTRRLLIRVRELARYEPDLLIVYSGHVEIAERRFYAHLIGMPPRLFRIWEALSATRLYAILNALRPTSAATGIGVEQPLDSRQMFETRSLDRLPDAEELQRAAAEYRDNLGKMIDAMHAVGARVMLLTIAQDFADWPPGASLHRRALSTSQLERWQALVAAGDALAETSCPEALASWGQALRISDGFAELRFKMGNCQRSLGMFAEARDSYRLASDLDATPLGAPTHYNEIVRQLARERGTLFFDAYETLVRASPEGMVGENLFTDFVHPNLLAHQLIGGGIVEVLFQAGLPVAAELWARGTYSEPDVAALYEATPELRYHELLVRALACRLVYRPECADTAAREMLATRPGDRRAEELLRWARSADRSPPARN